MKKILNNDKCLKIIVIFLFFTSILTVFQFINTYKKYNNNKGENVYLAFFNGDQQLTEMPQKGNTQGLGFEHAECNNGASVEWNRENWAPIVTNMTKNKTKCNLYFASNLATNYLYDILDKDTTTLAYDDTDDSNLRYIGASPKNYIDIGDRDPNGNKILWRIIGVMNNMTVINDDKTESTGQSLVKIIRADSIGQWSWDSSALGVNGGYGVNEWSQADIMTTLNEEAYWNKTSGQCYFNYNNEQKTCNFSSSGLTVSVKDKIAKVRWNTGTAGEVYNSSKITANYMYEGERSTHNGKEQCASSGGTYCNDGVSRTTTWDGFIGLMYLSDYGYAVGGDVRNSCLAKVVGNWSDSSPNCKGNDWLYYSSDSQWTITPVPRSSRAEGVFFVSSYGFAADSSASAVCAVRPTAYLKSNIKIKTNSASNYGSQGYPFAIEGVS